MPSWEELKDRARHRYRLEHEDDNNFSLIWDYDSGRQQRIFIRRFEAFDQTWIEYRSAACKAGDLDPAQALRRNAAYAVGSLALEDEYYWVMYSHPLRELTDDEFALPLQIVARTADEIEEEFTRQDVY